MRCPSCNKFPAFSTDNEPEVELEIDLVEAVEPAQPADADTTVVAAEPAGTAVACVTVYVTGTVRIVLTTECCGDEAKESNFEVEGFEVCLDRGDGCVCDLLDVGALQVSSSQETTDRAQAFSERIAKRGPNKGQVVKTPIPFRFQKRFYGADVTIEVSCTCGKTTAEEKWADETQASGMDEVA